MEHMPPEARAKGAAELLAIGADMDSDLLNYMSVVTNWAIDMREKYSLSDEALAVLLNTAPAAGMCVVAKYEEELNRRGLAI